MPSVVVRFEWFAHQTLLSLIFHDMKEEYIYIEHNAVIALNERPLGENIKIRAPLNKIFNHERTFEEHRMNFLGLNLNYRKPQLIQYGDFPPIMMPRFVYSNPSHPFIKNLGPIVFNSNSLKLISSGCCTRNTIIELLAGRRSFNEPNAKKESIEEIAYYDVDDGDETKPIFFGYNPWLEDQRHNHLFYETAKSLKIKHHVNNKCIASGKIKVHIYPFGYIVLKFSLNINYNLLSEDINTVLKETRLTNSKSTWLWKSKFGDLPLAEILKNVKFSILDTLYEQDDRPSLKEHIFSSIKYTEHFGSEINLLKGDMESFVLFDNDWNETSEYFYINPQSLIYQFSNKRKFKSSLIIFEKLNYIYEYAFLKKLITNDLNKYLKNKILDLKEYRFSLSKKLIEEDIYIFSEYEAEIPRFVKNYFEHISNAPPFHRKIYSLIEKGINLDYEKNKLNNTLKDWEQEVEKWDNPLKALWNKILSPLKGLLG